MYCKWCGMDSRDDKRCEWCGRPFPTPGSDQSADQTAAEVPPVTTAVPPMESAPQVTQAVPLTSEPVDATTAMSPPAQDIPDPGVPFNPRLTGLKPIQIEVAEIAPIGVRMEKYFGMMLPLLAAGMAMAHYMPNLWLVPTIALIFLSGLLMASFRVVEYYDNEFGLDFGILLAASMFVGPAYATFVYLLFGFIKRDVNLSLIGLMASLLVIRLAVGSAAHGFQDTITYLVTFNMALNWFSRLILLFPTAMLIIGWMCASFTQPLNE